MDWIDATSATERDLADVVSVIEAARVVDAPHERTRTRSSVLADLTHGWDGDAPTIALARDEHGRALGFVMVTLLGWDNRHLGFVEPVVDPFARRRGIGRLLFDAGADAVRASGRTLLITESWDTPGCKAFAKEMRLERASDAVKRSQYFPSLDRSRIAAERNA
jgi:GNAT superfamily N-acetyltransferase